MPKPIPTPTFRNIRPPNRTNYIFLEDIQNHPFLPQATTFERVNAGWLADLSLLAYDDEAFIQQTLDDSGLTAAGFAMRFFSHNTTQGFVVHNDEFVVVSMRGTEIDNFWGAVTDWLNNLEFRLKPDASGGRVHEGFMEDVAEVWNDNAGGLKSYLQALLASGTRTLWITGHSLGAALATLVAERAVRDGGFAVRGVYTYGSPRVGDILFKQNFEARGLNAITYRILHDIDIARRLFPGADYIHVGQFKFIDANGQWDLARIDAPALTTLQRWTLGLYPLFAWSGAFGANPFGLTLPEPIADHAPIYYASHIWNNQ